MRIIRLITIVIVLDLLIGCSKSGSTPASANTSLPVDSGLPDSVLLYESGKHIEAVLTLEFNSKAGRIEIVHPRLTAAHLDLAWFWKYIPEILTVELIDHNINDHTLTVGLTFKNPMPVPLYDVRMIFPQNQELVPLDYDGWTLRPDAELSKPNLYFGFGNEFPQRKINTGEKDKREIKFKYKKLSDAASAKFVLDATVNTNTAEPYAFAEPKLYGRFFYIKIRDWQDDIASAILDITPSGYPKKLRMAKFGSKGEWGTSIPDISSGKFRFMVTAESPESKGEDGEGQMVKAVHYVDLVWPPDGPLVPLPKGQGIYGFQFVDPDTNKLPTNPVNFMEKYLNEMGARWLIIEYGEICNSGYLAMNSWTPTYVEWMHKTAPNLPIHLNLDNLGFVPVSLDPCLHPVENYTKVFFDNLLESIRGQILENPAFDKIAGIHFDIEPFPQVYTSEELRAIYDRYADFLARLHLEPKLRGRNITLWDFKSDPYKTADILTYLATTDAFMPSCYYSGFTWDWQPYQVPTPFFALQKKLATYAFWSEYYGRPYYPTLENFGGWVDGMMDTLGDITICSDSPERMIDEHCFGKSAFNTSNEFEVVKNQAVHGMVVEKAVLNLPTGEPIFPASGLAVYRLGDGEPSTVSDDFVYCRTAYSMSKQYQIVKSFISTLVPGFSLFRYETNHEWKAWALGHPLPRGGIAGVSGRIHFDDQLDIQNHKELWGKITIELIEPLTPSIVNNPAFRKKIDIVGVEDGSYLFPDLPREVVKIRASAPGWLSQPVTVDLRSQYCYKENVDLLLEKQ